VEDSYLVLINSYGKGASLIIRKLMPVAAAILLLMIGIGCAPEERDGSDVLVFSNPPESQRFTGNYGATRAAEEVVDFEHYLLGYGTDNPRLYIEYRNTSDRTIKIEIGIIWYIALDLIPDQSPQHDIRPPILLGQGERLVYTPSVETPSKLIDYYVEVHSLLDEQLPHVSLGPLVGPMESTLVTGQDELTTELPLLAVPFFSQQVGRWVNDKLGTDGPLISRKGCALTSAAMVMAYYGVDIDPGRLNAKIGRDGYDENYQLYWSAVRDICHTRENQIEYTGSANADFDRLNEELDESYPVIAWVKSSEVPMHFIVFRGKTEGKYHFLDPADKNVTDRIWPDGYHGTYELQGLRIYHGNH
jgi:hypothetical protein